MAGVEGEVEKNQIDEDKTEGNKEDEVDLERQKDVPEVHGKEQVVENIEQGEHEKLDGCSIHNVFNINKVITLTSF